MEGRVYYIVEQGMYSERDQMWGFRNWTEHSTKEEAIKEAKKLPCARVQKIKTIYLVGIKEVKA